MITATRSIYIEAPVEKVFDFYKDPRNWAETAPVWLDATYTDVNVTPKGTGTTFSYKGKMVGVVDVDGAGELTEVVPNRRIVMQATDPVQKTPETMTFLFEPVGSGTTMTMVDEREPMRIERIPLVGRLAEWVVDELGSQWMRVLKAKMEA
jgi:uncharacterized protein YndB with AHSA1/START domain